MAAFIIFWAALLCVVFFLLGVLFKGLASLFQGILMSVTGTLAITLLVGFGELIVFGILFMAVGIRDWGVANMILTIVVDTVLISIIVVIVLILIGGPGAVLLSITLLALEYVIGLVSMVLGGAAVACEKAYVFFLSIIIKQLDKC